MDGVENADGFEEKDSPPSILDKENMDEAEDANPLKKICSNIYSVEPMKVHVSITIVDKTMRVARKTVTKYSGVAMEGMKGVKPMT